MWAPKPPQWSALTTVVSKCEADEFQKELDDYVFDRDHIILPNDYGYTISTKLKDIICTCTHTNIGLQQILPNSLLDEEVISYPQCPRVLFTAFMRQLRDINSDKIKENTINEFHSYCDKVFMQEIEPLLENFTYDVEAWMNSLETKAKQKEVLPFYEKYKKGILSYRELEDNLYKMFAKKEKQIIQTNPKVKYPKCRAISACSAASKFVGGPVIKALEYLFNGRVRGYKLSFDGKACKNWSEIEKYYDDSYDRGYVHSVDIDGSAWDSTQRDHMKYMTRKIYHYLVEHNKIHHVDPAIFLKTMTAKYRSLRAVNYMEGKSVTVFHAIVKATTLSGSTDTMFDNTMANKCVTQFSMLKCGLTDEEYLPGCSGDDGSTLLRRIPPDMKNIITTTWEELGLYPKMVDIGDYSDITFCSTNVIQYKQEGKVLHKVVRKLDRMTPLSHYTEKIGMSIANRKYYYYELARGLDTWAHDMPLYGDYAKAYRTIAHLITVPPAPPKDRKPAKVS